MNCFQNCIFTYDSQLLKWVFEPEYSCELLSELYFYLWFPTHKFRRANAQLLWIAFRIVFLLMIPNRRFILYQWFCVVNCFQNCIFTYDSQLELMKHRIQNRCELLSELYFYLWFPTTKAWLATPMPLWIAFRIVFLLMIPNRSSQ